MVGNEIGKYFYTEPENVATPPIDAVEKLFRNKDDGQFYYMNRQREIKLVAGIKYRISGFLNQVGILAPVLTEVENSSNYKVVPTYEGVGDYTLVVDGLEVGEKILLLTQSISKVNHAKVETINLWNSGADNIINVKSWADLAPTNGLITNIAFQALIYKV